jgi:uncharacterized protein YggE
VSLPRSLFARSVLVAAIGLAALALLALNLSAWQSVARGTTTTIPVTTASGAPSTGITVQGVGRITLTPDLATVSVGIQSQAATAAAAQSAASAAMTKIIAAVKKAGVAETDMTSQWVSLQPQYAYAPNGGTPPRVTGYQANQNLSVKVRKIKTTGPVIDAAVGAGATQVNGISFSVSDPTSATAQARTAAMADAKKRAGALAQAAGVSLGAIIAVTEVSAPAPVPFAAGDVRAGLDAATPVQVGTTDLEVDVTATFAIGG